MFMRTLYKKTSTGATQIWKLEIEGSKYRTVSGQKDGAQVESSWKEAKPKNTGRSNATTAEEQAQVECDAKYMKKLAQGGYHEDEDAIGTQTKFDPMLAYPAEKFPIDFDAETGIVTQPKLDGIRCIARADGLWTRQGKPIPTCPHVIRDLEIFFECNPDAILDGELYADNLKDDFNEIISLVRKQKPTPEHFKRTEAYIRYHIYDCPSAPGTFNCRWDALLNAKGFDPFAPGLEAVMSIRVNTQEELDSMNQAYLNQGYEGQIIRRDGPYKNGRSKDLLKRKEFIDEEYEIISVDEGEGNRAGMAGRVTCKLADGRTFGAGIKGSWEYAKGLLDNADTYIGGEVTVRYFQLTPDGVPRFPVAVALYENGRDS